MTWPPFPVLWLCGPPGVGKSTVGWELFARLDQDGVPVAYVDIDQLAMSFPTSDDDPDRDRMKARNVRAVIGNARAAGARCVIVSGVLEPGAVDLYEDTPDAVQLTWCLLRVGDDEIAERLARRGWSDAAVGESLQNAQAMAASSFADVSIDTAGLSVPDVAGLVQAQVPWWPTERADRPDGDTLPVSAISDAPGPVLLVCGPPGVGKSTVGWAVFEQVLAAGAKAAFVDLGQLGFFRPSPTEDPANSRLTAATLAAMWTTYRDAGADCLIVNGRVDTADDLRRHTDALPAATVTVCRLTAGRDELTRRIMRRGQPGGLELAGDELVGQPDVVLRRVIEDAIAIGAELARVGIGDLCVDTNGRGLDEIAREIRYLAADWPPTGRAAQR